MGHTRLGPIATTLKWKRVVANMAGGAEGGPAQVGSLPESVETIAAQALAAAQIGLRRALDDPGLSYSIYVLIRVALASREADWTDRLGLLGIRLSEDSSVFDLSAQVQDAIDDFLVPPRQATDISEMAQQAAGDALISLVGPRSDTLFGSSGREVQLAVRSVSTTKGFADLGQKFFGGFLARFLNFYLSRVTAAQVGSEKLGHVGALSEFNRELDRHCEQSAFVVRDFCGEWYSKTAFEGGITPSSTSRFVAVAIKKLQAELMQQEIQP